MQIIVMFLWLGCILSQSTYAQATGHTAELSGATQFQANAVLMDLIASHPDAEFRKKFRELSLNKSFYIALDSNRMPPEMATIMVSMNSRLVPVLEINPMFLLDRSQNNFEDDKKYKQLVLYHEYTHIINHMSGKAKLTATNFKPEEAAQRAKSIWESEWLALLAEWNLAKQMRVEYLVGTVDQCVKKFGERRGYLEAFYMMIMVGLNSSQPELFRPTWHKLYEAEKLKLITKK